MRQRGRKSATNLALIDVTGTPPRLTTPAGLTKVERSLFDFIVDASPPHHFTDSDQPLLLSYVQACLIARSSAKIPTKVSVWERAVRVQAMLATKLRLSPQTRTRSQNAGAAIRRFQSGQSCPVGWSRCSISDVKRAASAMRIGWKSIACIQMVSVPKLCGGSMASESARELDKEARGFGSSKSERRSR